MTLRSGIDARSLAGAVPMLPKGRLAENVLHFVRVLRAAGLPVGPAHTLAALAAVEAVGLDHREDFRAALCAVLVSRHDQLPVFEQAFEIFWRNPRLLEKLVASLLPTIHGRTGDEPPLPSCRPASRRRCSRRADSTFPSARTTRPGSTPRSRCRRAKCCSTRTSSR